LANRDSLPYAEKYGLGSIEGLDDCFRGTLRYKGFSKLLEGFRSLGLMSQTPLFRHPESWEDLLRLTISDALGEAALMNSSSTLDGVRSLTPHSEEERVADALGW
jgi:alpha-aminoadipic semialdehyde synthase